MVGECTGGRGGAKEQGESHLPLFPQTPIILSDFLSVLRENIKTTLYWKDIALLAKNYGNENSGKRIDSSLALRFSAALSLISARFLAEGCGLLLRGTVKSEHLR